MPPPSFREAFDSLAPAMFRYLRRLTGSRSDAEEIVQNAFLKLHVEMTRGVQPTNVKAWLFRVATNEARDLQRERVVRARDEALPRVTNVVDFESRLHAQQITRQALLRLPPRMRQVLLLWSEGFSYREIAEVTGIETGYVGVLLQRARAAFKREYEQLETVAGSRSNTP
ncbi:MAG TPA: sigma-70 family RNA polymerase sigma factor [Thermoanaerobaculia bacterium]|nr:sigma-70 family RNA polymerase sigma factor [Thermoanaerobaculia bacterium]